MALTGTQYQSMRRKLRGLLSSPFQFVSENELDSFLSQLVIDSANTADVTTAQRAQADTLLASALTAPDYVPQSADVSAFFVQAAGAAPLIVNALVANRYQQIKNAITGALSLAGIRTEANMLSYFGGVFTTTAPIIAQITTANGCQLAFDTDYCPGAVDGSPVIAITNRSGSNAIFDSVNNWGHGATTLPVWRKTGWGRTQSCLYFANTGMRFTGTDIAGCVTGVGKLFHMLLIYQPLFEVSTPTTVNVTAGWCNSGGSQFVNGMTSWYQNPRAAGAVPQLLWQGKAAANVADGVRSNWVPTCFEMARSDTTHIRSTFNGRVSTPVAYANGTSIDADGVYVGAWANATNDGINSSQLVRAGFFWDHLLSAGELTTMYSYVRTYYRGFDWQLGLGAT